MGVRDKQAGGDLRTFPEWCEGISVERVPILSGVKGSKARGYKERARGRDLPDIDKSCLFKFDFAALPISWKKL